MKIFVSEKDIGKERFEEILRETKTLYMHPEFFKKLTEIWPSTRKSQDKNDTP